MKFSEVMQRVNGLSCPIFGVSWNPAEAEVTVARRVITFLEDRRVLFVPSEMEMPDHCVQSVLQIREALTHEIGRIATDSELRRSLRAMRTACRKFLSTIEYPDRKIVAFGAHPSHFASWIFNGALGEMRGVFGIHIARIATQHGLDVEDELAAILPAVTENDAA